MNKKTAAQQVARATQQMLPDHTVAGDPFWVLMAERNGQLTGNYYVMRNGPKLVILLFLTRREAEHVLAALPAQDTYVVRGVTKEHLDLLLKLVARLNGRMELGVVLNATDPNDMKVSPMSADHIRYIAKHGELPPLR